MAKKVGSKQSFGDVAPSKWPGERLNLPKTGSLSIARMGRRVGAIILDWMLASLISFAVTRMFFEENPSEIMPTVTLIIFAVLQIIFIPTIGGSIGHRVFGMRVINLNGGWVGVWRPLVRTVLLILVLPLLVWDSDQRAFHDKIPGTALVLS